MKSPQCPLAERFGFLSHSERKKQALQSKTTFGSKDDLVICYTSKILSNNVGILLSCIAAVKFLIA